MKNMPKKILQNLVAYNMSVDFFEKELSNMALSKIMSDDLENVILNTKQIIKVMKKFIDGKITANELTRWAELVEQRDGIVYEKKHRDEIADVIFWLSTPEINGELTIKRVSEYIAFLENKTGNN